MTAIAEPTDVFPPAADEECQAWAKWAACRGRTELFFPPYAERPQARVRREQRAKLLCQTCPARMACLDWGRRHHEYGIWGGENEEERVLAGYSLMAPIGTRHLRAGAAPTTLAELTGPTVSELAATEAWADAGD